MIVIAIVGILAAVAVPSYRDYIIKTKIVEAINYAAYLKNVAIEYYNDNGVMPHDDTTWHAVDSEYIKEYQFYGAVSTDITYIHVKLQDGIFSDQPSDAFVLLKVDASLGDVIQFTCGYDSRSDFQIPPKYLPANCQTEFTTPY